MKTMSNFLAVFKRNPRLIGIAADHTGYALKSHLLPMLRHHGHQVIDFGDRKFQADDDYADFVKPLALALSEQVVTHGIAICGNGVGASISANQITGVRACLIHETFSARQGVQEDNMNLIAIGGQVIGPALAWEVVQIFLKSEYRPTKARWCHEAGAIELGDREILVGSRQ